MAIPVSLFVFCAAYEQDTF